MDIQLVPSDKEEQQVQRTLKLLKPDLVHP